VSQPILLTDTDAPEVAAAAEQLESWRLEVHTPRELADALARADGVRAVLTATDNPNALRDTVERAQALGVPVIVGCADDAVRRRAVELRVDEWFLLPASPDEIAARIRSAIARVMPTGSALQDRVERVEYEQMLYDFLTGLPTLPVMIERSRALIKERGELVVLYFNFVRYSKIEEIYGWEKLDAVLETTASAVGDFLRESRTMSTSRVMVSFTNDDDFVFFHVPPPGVAVATDADIDELAGKLQEYVQGRIEAVHGEEIATLFDIYVGRAHVYYNPKVRLERLIYRGIREASAAAKGIAERERSRKVSDLRTAVRDRAVYVDYHPIVVATTGEVFGYEALARGMMRSLRSPEVMFEVAAHADMIWELSRICRGRALEGMRTRLAPNELLFLNVDPHDFTDPAFTEEELAAEDAARIVVEITERTAIKDYPKFRERLKAFRERGVRFAVDDAGSGYAGLGSIANLEPDFIKLDMSLISCIDTNFIKQNLVETMVRFANDQGAKVIAEGVERSEEFETVKGLGVHLVQGFFLHRPPSPPRPEATPGELVAVGKK
jgi:EAL domain-containing protein (putative c-di-GMP-specific phosphodiesterase class I)